MAMVTATRIQDDFSSNRLTSHDHPTDEDQSAGTPVWHGPQLAEDGLRTDGPIFRTDLYAAVTTLAKEAAPFYRGHSAA